MARLLISKGYSNVRPLLGGYDAWFKQGYPVEPHVPRASSLTQLSAAEPIR
jgi:3-mercaptopyruvate sulfurtransferase SseA